MANICINIPSKPPKMSGCPGSGRYRLTVKDGGRTYIRGHEVRASPTPRGGPGGTSMPYGGYALGQSWAGTGPIPEESGQYRTNYGAWYQLRREILVDCVHAAPEYRCRPGWQVNTAKASHYNWNYLHVDYIHY